MNIVKYIKKTIVKHFKKTIILGMVLFCLTLALRSPSYGSEGSLEGEWRLVSLNGQVVYDHLDGITAKFTREEDQENAFLLHGLAGCSIYVTKVTTNLDRIIIEPNIFFSKPVIDNSSICLWPTQEKEYLAAIQSVTSYKIVPGSADIELQLTYGGNKTLRYVMQ